MKTSGFSLMPYTCTCDFFYSHILISGSVLNRIRVVSAVGRFGLGRFGHILGCQFGLCWWVVSAVSRFGRRLFQPRRCVCVCGGGGGGGGGGG